MLLIPLMSKRAIPIMLCRSFSRCMLFHKNRKVRDKKGKTQLNHRHRPEYLQIYLYKATASPFIGKTVVLLLYLLSSSEVNRADLRATD